MPIKQPPPLLRTAEEPEDENNEKSIIMSVAQATNFLGYKDVHVVLNLLNNGELKGHKIGKGRRKRWVIWKSDLIDYINKH